MAMATVSRHRMSLYCDDKELELLREKYEQQKASTSPRTQAPTTHKQQRRQSRFVNPIERHTTSTFDEFRQRMAARANGRGSGFLYRTDESSDEEEEDNSDDDAVILPAVTVPTPVCYFALMIENVLGME